MQRNSFEEIFGKLKIILPTERLLPNELLSKHTTFRIGGPADYLVQPATINEVAAVVNLAKEYDIPITILGNGSNVLVLDKGIRGIVLKFGSEFSYISHYGSTVVAGAGALLAEVSRYASAHELSGLEFAVGIPGSIGGAVYMNAGAYQGEMSGVVLAVTVVCPNGNIQRFTGADSQFNYRHSIFQDNKCIICEVELRLDNGECQIIRHRMDEFTMRRETKQPLEMPSAGSTFKRPPGNFAGTLIEQAGLKGLKVGGAEVSKKHAGFVINSGGATAQDVLALIRQVQELVYENSGVKLEPEVRILGEA